MTEQRYLLRTCSQNGQTFHEFLINLRNKVLTCEFDSFSKKFHR